MSEPRTDAGPGGVIDVKVAFGEATSSASDDRALVHLPSDGERDGARVRARLHRPAVVRDAILALADVLASDLRYRARDRADYLAYLLSKGKGVSKQVWEAQKEYLRLRYSEAAREEEPLDPVVTVAPDAIRIELLSRDESVYAQLALRPDALADAELSPGTTHVALDPASLRAVTRMRTYRTTTLAIEPGARPVARERRVPLRWLRAVGQMQTAALLPAERFSLTPIDVYNVLLSLRMRKARTAPRALRYELVPGRRPRLVLEPWDTVLEGHGPPYGGKRPMVVRTWGRKRLLGLARVLPHARALHVALVGPGLPAFYVVDLGDATLTLGLSGWTDAGWGGIASFDRLGGAEPEPATADAVRAALAGGAVDLDRLIETAGGDPGAVRAAASAELAGLAAGVDLGARAGQVALFARPLLAEPVPAGALRYRDAREEQAHRLLAEPGQVTLTKVHDLGADGQTIEGQVDDTRAHRRYHASFTLDRDGRTAAARCTCPAFRRSGLKEGPCEHMIAVRVLHAREQARLESARGTEEGRKLIRAETRTLLRRTPAGSETFRISLDDRAVVSRWGTAEPLRVLRQLYASSDLARTAYFTRLDELAEKGFIDAGT